VVKAKGLKAATHKLDLLYVSFWNTHEGKAILADLKMRYLRDNITTDNPHTTIVRAAESNPIRYILRRIEDGMDG